MVQSGVCLISSGTRSPSKVLVRAASIGALAPEAALHQDRPRMPNLENGSGPQELRLGQLGHSGAWG